MTMPRMAPGGLDHSSREAFIRSLLPIARQVEQESGVPAEVLVAMAILCVALVSLAQLFIVATTANIAARHTTYASVLAAQKLEELRTLAWADLVPSPVDALRDDIPGYVDAVDGYTRRWSIDPLPADPDRALVIRVVVTRASAAIAEDVHMVVVRAKTAP